ncbi:MAG: histidine kinase dimerization/phospho-acceptor domain-containing protein, partial [Anaerolineae bacterium]
MNDSRISQTQDFSSLASESGDEELGSLHTIFIQNVSHELRTPLTIINGYTELLRDESLGPLAHDQRDAIHIIANRSNELRAIVEKIGILLAIEAHIVVSIQFTWDELVAEVVKKREAAA